VIAAIDVDYFACGGREEIRQEGYAGFGHGGGIVYVPAQRGSLTPHLFE
jgi:hypothetical protein